MLKDIMTIEGIRLQVISLPMSFESRDLLVLKWGKLMVNLRTGNAVIFDPSIRTSNYFERMIFLDGVVREEGVSLVQILRGGPGEGKVPSRKILPELLLHNEECDGDDARPEVVRGLEGEGREEDDGVYSEDLNGEG
jgi:hypothetical protein